MTTLEIKDILIHKIVAINDKSFLSAIKTLVDAKTETLIYRTSPEQKLAINEGLKQIAKGEYLANDQVEMQIDKWLKEK